MNLLNIAPVALSLVEPEKSSTFIGMSDENRERIVRELCRIPGVGRTVAEDLIQLGICSAADLRGADPEELYRKHNEKKGAVQDRCMFYVFRCVVYYASTAEVERIREKLQWWKWKDTGCR